MDVGSLLQTELGVEVRDLTRLPGGASRETWSFTAGDLGRLVLRRDAGRDSSGVDRATEAELLRRAAAASVPVPEVVRVGDGWFVMRHVDGETIARRILRDEAYARARPRLARECGEVLAKLHTIEASDVLPPAADLLAQYRTVLDAFGEPHPALELGFRWLERNPRPPGRTTIVHGDFRLGNLIVDEHGLRAVLDWELAHLGDPMEDLAWLCVRSWRFGGPGEVGGFGDRTDLYDAYARGTGSPVDPDAVRWWEVFGDLKWGIITIGQAFAHLWGSVRSLELAAIGRRTCEAEHDLLELIS